MQVLVLKVTNCSRITIDTNRVGRMLATSSVFRKWRLALETKRTGETAVDAMVDAYLWGSYTDQQTGFTIEIN